MSDAEFFAGLTGGQIDFARAVAALRVTGRPFCLIGGLAINYYVEPVVCESHARIIPLVPPGLIPEVDQLRS